MKKHLLNNMLTSLIIGAVLLSGISFYVGMHFGTDSKNARGQFTQGMGGIRGAVRGGGFTTGDVIEKDATSVTVKLTDGSTRIVLVGSKVDVSAPKAGSISDISVGTRIMVVGQINTDKSITAEYIQIRPTFASSTPTQGRQ